MDSRKQKRVKKLPIAQWRKDTTTLLTEIDQSFAKNAYKTNFTLRQRNKDRLQEYRNSHKVTANTQSDNTAKLIKMKNFIRKLEELAKAPPAEVSHTVDPKVNIMPVIADVDLTKQEKVNDTATTIQQPQENINDTIDILNAVAKTNEQQEVDNSKFAVHIEHDSRSDGDCFYSSIYLAAKKQDLLKTIGPCLQVNIEDETAFIQDMRNKAGDKVREDRNSGGTIYNNVKDLFASMSNNNATNLIRQSFPPWFKDKFGVHGEKIGDKDSFYDILEISVRTPKAWVFDTDSRFITELLNNSCGIVLQTYKESENQPIPQNLPKYLDNKPIIHLFLNADEKHYEYFSFNDGNTAIVDVGKSYQDVAKVAEIVDKKEVIEASEAPLEAADESDIEVINDLERKNNCETLYHPCTGVPITGDNGIKVIQQTLAELQKNKELMEFKIITEELRNGNRLDLLLWILNNFDKIEDINEVNLLYFKTKENATFAPDLFESYWDIIIAMGFLTGFERQHNRFMYEPDIQYLEHIPSIEGGKSNGFYSNPFEYLMKRAIKTHAGGASDITIYYQSTKVKEQRVDPCSYEKLESTIETTEKPKFVFCSSKKYKKEKSIVKYDILNIFGAAKKLNPLEFNKEILLLVSNEDEVKRIKQGARRKYISEEASDVFGQTTLIANLRRLYDFTKNISRPVTSKSLQCLFADSLMAKDAGGTYIELNTKLTALSLLLHQHMTVNYIAKGIQEFRAGKRGQNNRFLIGILPRGGKTYIAGGLISHLQAKNIVILLGAKSETQSQFIDELFNKFLNFNDYKVINVKDENDPSLKSGTIEPNKKHIFVMSIELFKVEEYVCDKEEKEVDDEKKPGYKKKILVCILESGDEINPKYKMIKNPILENRPLLKLLRGLIPDKKTPVDLFISDEAHLKQATKKAEKAVKGAIQYEEEDDSNETDETLATFTSIPVVYMTGTYRKPRLAFKIPPENTIIWDYEDVQKAKEMDQNLEYFQNSFGDEFKYALDYMILTGSTIETIMKSYQSFPELHLIETHFYQGVEESLLAQGDDKGLPDTTQLFILVKNATFNEPNKWHENFHFKSSMERLIKFLGPTDTGINSVMTSIDRIAQRTGDRLRLLTSDFVVHSQLWFLPKMSGNPLSKRIMALVGTIFQHPWFRKHFDILAVSGVDWQKELHGTTQKKTGIIEVPVDGEIGIFKYDIPNDKPLKERILHIEETARKQNKGVIILAQNMLNLGISLPCVSVVVLLDAGTDVDERIQKMYRALTQGPNKKDAFVVDLNYFRTINAITEYQIQAFESRHKRRATSEDRKKIIDNVFNIYSFNDDHNIFQTEELRGKAIEEIYEKQSQKDYSLPTDLVTGGEMMNGNIEDVIIPNVEYLDFLENHSETDKKAQKELLRKMATKLQKTQRVGDDTSENEKEVTTKPTDDILSKHLSYLDIFKTLLRYGVFATEYKNVEELKAHVDNDELQTNIYNLLETKGIIKNTLTKDALFNKIIIPNLELFLTAKKGDTYKAMKNYINDDTRYPAHIEDVLNYINTHLAPKDKERHKYGEVFTPLTLVDEMLSKLPEEVWSNKDFKWLDPANGIGNFPIKAFVGQHTGEYKYPGLMNGLAKAIPDKNKRYKHIVENMLFMVDINGKNNAIAKRLFEKLCPNAIANIEKIDAKKGFLIDKPLVFNGKEVKEFDIIFGNPPYNGGAIRAMTTNETRKKRDDKGFTQDKYKNLWIPFTNKALDLLKKNGYLLFIMPIGWFKPGSTNIHERMLSYQINNIRIIFNTTAKKIFGGSGEINVAYFLLENKESKEKTNIINIYNNNEIVKLKPNSIISLAHNNIFNKIQEKASLFRDSPDYKTSSINISKCFAGSNKQIISITNEGEIRYVKTDIKHQYQTEPKIILNGAKYPRVFYDNTGEYGLIGNDQHYFIGNSLNKLKDYFKTKLAALLLANIKYRMKFIEPDYYPDVRSLPIDKITDETLADYFGFTKEEREAINVTEYPIREYKFKEISCAELRKEPAEGGSRYSNKTRKNCRH